MKIKENKKVAILSVTLLICLISLIFMCFVVNWAYNFRNMPKNRIDSLKYDNNLVSFSCEDCLISNAQPTGSMKPLFNANQVIIKRVVNESDLQVGDVIIFRSSIGSVGHRIISIGYDPKIYFVTKGDNNWIPDLKRLRFSDIEAVLVAVIY